MFGGSVIFHCMLPFFFLLTKKFTKEVVETKFFQKNSHTNLHVTHTVIYLQGCRNSHTHSIISGWLWQFDLKVDSTHIYCHPCANVSQSTVSRNTPIRLWGRPGWSGRDPDLEGVRRPALGSTALLCCSADCSAEQVKELRSPQLCRCSNPGLLLGGRGKVWDEGPASCWCRGGLRWPGTASESENTCEETKGTSVVWIPTKSSRAIEGILWRLRQQLQLEKNKLHMARWTNCEPTMFAVSVYLLP